MYRLRLMTLTLAAGCLLYPCLGEWGRWLTMGENQPEESESKNQGFLCTTQQAQLQSSNQFKLIKFHWCDGCAGCAAVYHGQVAVSQQTLPWPTATTQTCQVVQDEHMIVCNDSASKLEKLIIHWNFPVFLDMQENRMGVCSRIS